VVGDGRARILDAIGRLASEARWTLVELTPERRDLEDIFRKLSHQEGGLHVHTGPAVVEEASA
jgi:hypothetical protein